MAENSTQSKTLNPLLIRMAVVLILLGAIFGLNALYHVLASSEAVITGDAGELIYAAGFDGFTDEWDQFEGRRTAEIADGVLRMSLDTPDTIFNTPPPVLADFDVRVTARAVDGNLTNDGYGIIFRLSENDTSTSCQQKIVLLCSFENVPLLGAGISLLAPIDASQVNGYYLFLISNDGYYQVLKGNSDTGLIEDATIWHYSNGLLNEGLGAENQIRIVGQGDAFMFFLNGEPALLCVPLEGQQPTGNSDDCLGEETYTWQDDTYQQGKVGVILNGATTAGDVIEFDNFTITIPDEIIFEGNNA